MDTMNKDLFIVLYSEQSPAQIDSMTLVLLTTNQ